MQKLKIIIEGWPPDSSDDDDIVTVDAVLSVAAINHDITPILNSIAAEYIDIIEDPSHPLCGWAISSITISQYICNDDDEEEEDETQHQQ